MTANAVGDVVRLLLASRSPRRAELLRAAGLDFEPGPFPDVDETPEAGVEPARWVEVLARRKVRAAARSVPRDADVVLLAADTLVHRGAEVLGKPAGPADAIRTLERLSGRSHEVSTGVAVCLGGRVESGVDTARVTFRPLGPEEIRAYVATGEPLDKAGAYGIQGSAARFVERVEGRRDTVIGLPLDLVRRLLDRIQGGSELHPSPPDGR